MTHQTKTNFRSSSTSSIGATRINDDTDEQRRKFLGMVGGAALLSTTSLPVLAGAEDKLAAPGGEGLASSEEAFRERAFKLRVAAAQADRDASVLPHPTNGDEERYQNYIGSDTRGLPHDGRGEVDPATFKATLKAYASGDPALFEAIPLGGTRKQLNPIGTLAVSLEVGKSCSAFKGRSDIFGVFGPLRSLQNVSLSEWRSRSPWSQSKPVLRLYGNP